MTTTFIDYCFYVSGEDERQKILPLFESLRESGCHVEVSKDLKRKSHVGFYVCESNSFFNYSSGEFNPLPSTISVVMLHDLWQDNGLGITYFDFCPWHMFNYAFLPGPRWSQLVLDAMTAGRNMPPNGLAEIGWPCSDGLFNNSSSFQTHVTELRQHLDLDVNKKTVLLATSWTNRRHLNQTLSKINSIEFQLIMKFPTYSSTNTTEGPWSKVLTAQSHEGALSRRLALNHEGVKVAPDDCDIFALLSLSDVVISNGSNISLEAVLAGKPAVCVHDWWHPAGNHGQLKNYPRLDIEGVVHTPAKSLGSSIKLACSEVFRFQVENGSAQLASKSLRGNSCTEFVSLVKRISSGQELNLNPDNLIPIDRPQSLVETAQLRILDDLEPGSPPKIQSEDT